MSTHSSWLAIISFPPFPFSFIPSLASLLSCTYTLVWSQSHLVYISNLPQPVNACLTPLVGVVTKTGVLRLFPCEKPSSQIRLCKVD